VESGDNTAGVLAGHAGLPREALDGLAAGGAAAATAGARHVVLSRVGGVQVVARRGRSPPRPAVLDWDVSLCLGFFLRERLLRGSVIWFLFLFC